jgi:hypothetical protein
MRRQIAAIHHLIIRAVKGREGRVERKAGTMTGIHLARVVGFPYNPEDFKGVLG